jgi:hypothetical protein
MLFLFSFVRLPLSEPGLRRSPLENAASVPIPLIVPVTVLGFGYRLLFFARVVPCRDVIPRAKAEKQARLGKTGHGRLAWVRDAPARATSQSEREFVRDYTVG